MGVPRSILVIDDEVEIVRLITEVLTEEGYSVSAAIGGEQAIAQLSGPAPALVLLDYAMPGLNGGDVMAFMRDRHMAATPVVIMSASRHADNLAYEGAAGFLPKPFELETLLQCVAQHLSPAA